MSGSRRHCGEQERSRTEDSNALLREQLDEVRCEGLARHFSQFVENPFAFTEVGVSGTFDRAYWTNVSPSRSAAVTSNSRSVLGILGPSLYVMLLTVNVALPDAA